MTKLLARWVFPVDQPPIERCLVEIIDGRVAAIESFRGQPDRDTVDLRHAAIIPALVNAHAHLEFSSLTSPIEPAQPFTGWIGRLLAHRRERDGQLTEYIREGIAESAWSGAALLGDIVTGDWDVDCVPRNSSSVVAFRELIGFLPESFDGQIEIARQHISQCRSANETGAAKLFPALSPHAPYSVGPELFEALVSIAKSEDVPLCIHLAETLAELELLKSGTGEFREMLTRFDLWRDGIIQPNSRTMDYLQTLADVPHALIAHGNYLANDEIAFLSGHPNIATVYCPRTHQFFGHPEHPWLKLVEAGATVCLGTDGRSSNPDYSMWNELKFLDRLTLGSERPRVLHLATLAGASALGCEQNFGSLATGMPANLAVVPLAETASEVSNASDPWTLLFEAKASPGLWWDSHYR